MLVVSRLLKVSAILRLQYIRAFRGMSLYPKTYVFWQSKKIKILEYSGTHFQNNLMRSVYLQGDPKVLEPKKSLINLSISTQFSNPFGVIQPRACIVVMPKEICICQLWTMGWTTKEKAFCVAAYLKSGSINICRFIKGIRYHQSSDFTRQIGILRIRRCVFELVSKLVIKPISNSIYKWR